MRTGDADRFPNCRACRHFFITHEPRQPHGCRAYGFKSREFPSRVVQAASGRRCHFHAPRQTA